MKRLFLFISIMFAINIANAQDVTVRNTTEEELNKMSLTGVCDFIGIPSDYSSRYYIVVLPLCEAGVQIFDGKLNKYYDYARMHDNDLSCYWYSGQVKQNAKLKRNLIKNRHLFKDGKLIEKAAELWVIVD